MESSLEDEAYGVTEDLGGFFGGGVGLSIR